MTFEDDLRATMHGHADAAPRGAALLAGVQARSRKLKRRRIALAGGTLAAIIALVVTVPQFTTKVVPPVGATPSPSVAKSVLGPAGDYDKDLPSFPYVPQWIPPQLGELTAGLSGYYVSLQASTSFFTITVGPTEPFQQPLDTEHKSPVTISGKPATLRTGTMERRDVLGLNWKDGDRYVAIFTTSLTPEEAIRFAENLQPGVTPIVPSFKVSLLPPDHQLVSASRHELCFLPKAVFAVNPQEQSLCLRLMRTEPSSGEQPGERRIIVRGHPATFQPGQQAIMRVTLKDGWSLNVTSDHRSIGTEDDLRLLIEGMTFTDPTLE